MKCSKCGQPLDPGAVFCGNCGQPVNAAAASAATPATQPQPQPAATPSVTPEPTAAMPAPTQPGATPAAFPAPPAPNQIAGASNIPAYAAAPTSHPGEVKAIIGLIAGVLSMPGALIPIVAFVLGITALVLGKVSLRAKKTLAILALVFGGIGIILGVCGAIYNLKHDPKLHHLTTQTSLVSTPCFDVNLSKDLHVSGDKTKCNIDVMNGADSGHSTTVYTVRGMYLASLNSSNFETSASKIGPSLVQGINNAQSARTYKLDSEERGTFAGEPSHSFNVSEPGGTHGEIMVVLHTSPNGNNLFEIEEFVLKGTADLSTIASDWSWK